MNRQGIAVDLTEVTSPEGLRNALERPDWWDLILCDGASVESLAVETVILAIRDDLDASLVLVKAAESPSSAKQGHRLGAADLVVRDDPSPESHRARGAATIPRPTHRRSGRIRSPTRPASAH
ncbi:hypothetical protein [Thiocapsa sp.]|uniref:hypothetical protein n=1 Tax=Thiocapsa sp. TaxID=2024551 RepID=UPI002C889C2E|nr:hypothetical protein [Thiocapsa sp.]HSO83078.1 hypothetical protein [Thiocapsa sp.]